MSQTRCPSPLFASKEDFLTRGLISTTLEGPIDCSICHEPLAMTNTDTSAITPPPASQQLTVEITCLPRLSIIQDTATACLDPPCHLQGSILNTQSNDLVPSEPSHDSNTYPFHESPIQIRPCSHVFGKYCLEKWFLTATSNRCPSCNLILFPKRNIHLAFRDPTRAMRGSFANYVVHVFKDPEIAQSMREELSGKRARSLMRELAIEIWSSQGFEVTWEYVYCDLDGIEFDDEMSSE